MAVPPNVSPTAFSAALTAWRQAVGKQPPVLLDRTDLAPQAVAVFVRQGVLLMAPFRKTEITDAELAALSAYVAGKFKQR